MENDFLSQVGHKDLNQNNLTKIPKIKSIPHLLYKEGTAALIALVLLCTMAVLVDAPIEGPADVQGMSSMHVKAPWIFVGIQQMLRYLPAILAGIILPVGALLLTVFLPFVPAGWMGRAAIFFLLLAMTLFMTLWGYLA